MHNYALDRMPVPAWKAALPEIRIHNQVAFPAGVGDFPRPGSARCRGRPHFQEAGVKVGRTFLSAHVCETYRSGLGTTCHPEEAFRVPTRPPDLSGSSYTSRHVARVGASLVGARIARKPL